MFTYKGKNTETGEQITKEFEYDYEARDFADNNMREYDQYEIYDDQEDDIIYSTELDEDVEATARENMYPEGEDD